MVIVDFSLYSRLTELSEQLRSCEEKSCIEREGLLSRLHSLTSENTATKLENQRLKAINLLESTFLIHPTI